MKRLLSMLGAIALATPAGAADLAVKAPPLPPAYNWTGFYFGLDAGGAISAFPLNANGSFSPALAGIGDPGVLGTGAGGFVAGGFVGFNWQFAPQWVLGFEVGADATGLNSNGSGTSTLNGANLFTVTSKFSLPWDAYADAKLGFLIARNLMLYGIGGFSFGEIKENASLQSAFSGGAAGAFDDMHSGWNLGAGIDWCVDPHVCLGARYRYVSYGTRGVPLQDPSLLASFDPAAKAAFNEMTVRLTVPLY